jgi:hypothetical protein
VTRLVLVWLGGAALATLGLLIARTIAPGRHELELDVYVIMLGALALLGLVSWLRRSAPAPRARESLLEHALQQHVEEPETLPELAHLERVLVMSAAQEFDLHYRLRPTLREITAARLAERGLQLDRGGPLVQESLGEELWDVVRPDRVAPENRQVKGVGGEGIERLVRRIEGAQ